MVLKKNRDGNFMVGCLGFPQCRNAVWLPGPVAEAVVTTNTCNFCTPGPVYMIQFKFRQLEIPPNYNVNLLARARGPTAPTSNAHHTILRQSVCTHCQQTGHSSNDCPSQRNARHHGANQHSGEASVSCSSCGTPCVLRTANTANNRGRKFYSCQSQECNFFVWEDNLNNGTGGRGFTRSNSIPTPTSARGRNGGRGPRGRGRNGSHSSTFVSATGDPISGRRCFVCGDPSHFANVCPNRGV